MDNTLSEYVKRRATTVSDINSIRYGGFYDTTSNSAMPDMSWYWLIFLPHTSNGTNYRYGTYLCGRNGSTEMYFCNAVDGQTVTSSSWTRL